MTYEVMQLSNADVLRHLRPEGRLYWDLALAEATIEVLQNQIEHLVSTAAPEPTSPAQLTLVTD